MLLLFFKNVFFMTVKLPYNQHNNTISIISQVLVDTYLIHSVHTTPNPTYTHTHTHTHTHTRIFYWGLSESQLFVGFAGKEGAVFT